MTRKLLNYAANFFVTMLGFFCANWASGEFGKALFEEYYWYVRTGLWAVWATVAGIYIWRFTVRWNEGAFLFDD